MSLEEKIQRLVYEYDRHQAGLPAQVPEDVKKIQLFSDTVAKHLPPFEARVALLTWEFAYKNYVTEKGAATFEDFRKDLFGSPKNIHYYSQAFEQVAERLPKAVTVEDLNTFRGGAPEPRKMKI